LNLPAERWAEQIGALEWPSEPPLWTGDGRLLEAPGHFWGAAAVELVAAPTLRDGELPTAAASEHRQLASRIVRSLRPWQNAGSFELRYVWGDPRIAGRLRVLLIGRALGRQLESARTWAAQMLENVTALFPAGYEFGPVQTALPDMIEAWAEIERVEEARLPGPFVPPGVASYYYLVHPLGGSGAAWPGLPRVLADVARPGFLSIALVPTIMTDLERAAIDRICTLARHLSEPQPGYDFFGNQTTTPADAAARDLYAAWQHFPERTGVLARIGVATSRVDLARVASLVGSVIVDGAEELAAEAPTNFKIVADLTDYEAFQATALGLVFPRSRHEVWKLPENQAPISVERMPYFFSELEAGGLLVLPVPDEQGLPGMPRARVAASRREVISRGVTESGLRLGTTVDRGRAGTAAVVPLSAVNRHTLIVGASGWGKTTTVLTMLAELWREHHIPFFVLEPTKTEYRSLLDSRGFAELRVICLGRDDIAPLRLNPLAPPPKVRREVHVNAVMAALKLALPLLPPLPQLLEEALDHTYELAGWDYDTRPEDGLAPPTLRSLLDTFEALFKQQGYVGEANNVGVALSVRLRSLLRGSRGRMLDTVESVEFTDLMSRPVVVEMDEISDNDDKLVLSALMLDRVRSAARARGSSGGQLQHVTVIEEAHRLLSGGIAGDKSSGDNLRADAVGAFCDAISELRGYGEGFILSSQSPTALASGAVANTSVRILHLMESSDDREVMLRDLEGSPLDREVAARLAAGEALARWPGREEAELIKVQPADGVDSGRRISDDQVRAAMAAANDGVYELLPYSLCTRDMCLSGCQPRVRSTGHALAVELGAEARKHWSDAGEHKVQALEPIMSGIRSRAGAEPQLAYCTAVHLAVANSAFNFRGGIDIRPRLIQAVRKSTEDQ
jgi:DNA helicase HerA-like ATPase